MGKQAEQGWTPQWMVSVDDHVIEKATLWTERLPRRYADVGPRIDEVDGAEVWRYEDKSIPTLGLVAVAGRTKDEWTPDPIRYEDMHPGCYDPAARIADMNVAGILTQTCFPSFPRFCGQTFAEGQDKELAELCVRAWNDHMIEEWAEAYPGRFIPLAMVPMWDAELAAKEARRAIGKGARGILFSENASKLGYPSVHDVDRYWDPLWEVANEAGTPICCHLGSSSQMASTSPDNPTQVPFALQAINTSAALVDFIFSGLFFRFPNLKLVLSEGEIGWIPFMLHWCDHVADTQRWAIDRDYNVDIIGGSEFALKERAGKVVDLDHPPSALFRDHVYGCFIDDPVGVRLLDLIGEDNVMVETDYPHTDGTWPNSIELISDQLAGLPEPTQRKLLTENAARVFQFEPAQPPTFVNS